MPLEWLNLADFKGSSANPSFLVPATVDTSPDNKFNYAREEKKNKKNNLP
jgi:hypothetical protein